MAVTLDGVPPHLLARRWGVPRVLLHGRHASSLDAAHEQAGAGAPAGTVILVEEQTDGRGRDGRTWSSAPGGVWLAVVLRPRHTELGAAAIRAGLVVADTLDELLGGAQARVKWPNDVLLGDRKVAGVLCEGRWQGDALQWLALGVGINVHNALPAEVAPRAMTLGERLPAVRRLAVLDRLVPGLVAIARHGPRLTEAERAAFAVRDWLSGRALRRPLAGRSAGVADDGALLVAVAGRADAATVREGHVELA
jgi:BirA family biotin operon repressor/biotin-[acetyl-CoA-carboxylase] ligase